MSGRVLYVTYDGLLEPLGASQVLPYVEGLAAAGIPMEILSFEKPADLTERARVEAMQERLARAGVAWQPLRYHKRPSLPATAWDVAAGRRAVARWAGRFPRTPRLVHARGYLPGLMGMAGVARGARLLFDMRGFWVDERIEAGYWRPGSLPVRLGRRAERLLLSRAHHLVLLTHRAAARLRDLAGGADPPAWTVVPTCVDTRRFRPPADRAEARRRLALGDGPVLLHTGTLTGWYLGGETVRVGAAFARRTGGRFVVLTRDVAAARRLLREEGVEARVASVAPEDMPGWLQAADAGLALVRPSPAKDASFPTKVGEYLAAGLAVLATPVGDMERLEDGCVVRLLRDGESAETAAAWLAEAVQRPDRTARARALAEERLAVRSGVEALRGVYRGLGVPGRGPSPGGRPQASPLRVLAMAPYPATAPSTRFRLEQFVEPLRREGIDLRLRPFVDAAEYARVRAGGVGAWLTAAGALRRARNLAAAATAADVVVVQRGVAPWGAERFVRRIAAAGVPLVYDFDDAVFLPQAGGRALLERLRAPERSTTALCRAARVVLAGNAYLADFAARAREDRGEGVRILPTVVDTERFVPRAAPPERSGPPVLGWVGSDSTLPYLETLAPVLRELAREVDFRLVVVAGTRPPRLDGIEHDFVRWSVEDEVALVQALDVGLYPLDDTPWSRGKCGFKAIQYLACAVPCVASPVGVLRDIVRAGEVGFHATSPREWVEACGRLLGDAALREAMGRRGRTLVEREYSVRSVLPTLTAALRRAAVPAGASV